MGGSNRSLRAAYAGTNARDIKMSETRSNTLCVGATTYNLSQINSVSVQCVELSSSSSVWPIYVSAGVFSWISLPHFLKGQILALVLLFGTLAATGAAVEAINSSRYKLFRITFDMSSGSVSAFETRDEAEAFRMRDDIIEGIETGILPEYLRSNL